MAKRWLNSADVEVSPVGALLVQQADGVGVSGVKPIIDVVTVAASATLTALLAAVGSSFRTSTKRVTLRPHAVGIYMDDGEATANSDPLGESPVEIAGGAAELGELQFFAAAGTKMTVIQEG